jgi:hypothetical protein
MIRPGATGQKQKIAAAVPGQPTDHSPARARAITSRPAGRVYSLSFSTSRSHAARLYATGSKLPATTAHPRSLGAPAASDSQAGHAALPGARRQREGDRRRSRGQHHFRRGGDTTVDNVSSPNARTCGVYSKDIENRARDNRRLCVLRATRLHSCAVARGSAANDEAAQPLDCVLAAQDALQQ